MTIYAFPRMTAIEVFEKKCDVISVMTGQG